MYYLSVYQGIYVTSVHIISLLKDMKKINSLLRRCKTMSRELGRRSSYSSLRSKFTKEDLRPVEDQFETVFVGSSRKKYVINSKYLDHPLLKALIESSKKDMGNVPDIRVKCEVVLFDHLLLMLENGDQNLSCEALSELVDLYKL